MTSLITTNHIGPSCDLTAKLILYYSVSFTDRLTTDNFYDFISLASTSKTMYRLSKDELLNKELILRIFPNFSYINSFSITKSSYLKLLILYDRHLKNGKAKYFNEHLSRLSTKVDVELLFSFEFISIINPSYTKKKYADYQFGFRFSYQELFIEYLKRKKISSIAKFLNSKFQNDSLNQFGYYMDYVPHYSNNFMIQILKRVQDPDQMIWRMLQFQIKALQLRDFITNVCDVVDFKINIANCSQNNKEYGNDDKDLELLIDYYLNDLRHEHLIWLFQHYQLNISKIITQYLINNTNYDERQKNIYYTMLFIVKYEIQLDFDLIFSCKIVDNVFHILKCCKLTKIRFSRRQLKHYILYTVSNERQIAHFQMLLN